MNVQFHKIVWLLPSPWSPSILGFCTREEKGTVNIGEIEFLVMLIHIFAMLFPPEGR